MAAIVVGMFCMAYASVPLYNLFCRVTGFGGTTQVALAAPGATGDRTITVRFNADTNPNLPWDFKTNQYVVKVKPGEERLISYHAQNMAEIATSGTAIYNVTPDRAGIYFNKVECFCFNEQKLNAGESTDFPVSFFLDPELLNDPDMDNVDTITLSYTFFPLKES